MGQSRERFLEKDESATQVLCDCEAIDQWLSTFILWPGNFFFSTRRGPGIIDARA
jgi:hypothetical protein